jgi:hypothetical protein
MFRGLLTLLVLAAIVVGAASAASMARPSLRVAGLDPVTVRGSSFHARERVKVTLVSGALKRTLSVRTSAAGRFTATFDLLTPLDPCIAGWAVTAIGAEGDRASAKGPLRQCPPPP